MTTRLSRLAVTKLVLRGENAAERMLPLKSTISSFWLPLSKSQSESRLLSPPVKRWRPSEDRKSTRLNSSHQIISYAVFCLKKKKQTYELKSPDQLVYRLHL